MNTIRLNVLLITAFTAAIAAGCGSSRPKSATQLELDNIAKCFGQAVALQKTIPEENRIGRYMRASLFIVMANHSMKPGYQNFYRLRWDDTGKHLILHDKRKVTMKYIQGNAYPDKDGKARIEARYRFSGEGSAEHADIVIEVQTPDQWKKKEEPSPAK